MSIFKTKTLILLTILLAFPFFPSQAEEPGRVVILGFDGADTELVTEWMEEGQLPHLSKLKNKGTFRELQVTNPPQTPVSWSAFSTGKNPGKTQIFDFLKRQPRSYRPAFVLQEESVKPFLWGSQTNGWALPALAAGAVFLILILALIPAKKIRRTSRLLIALFVSALSLYPAHTWVKNNLPDRVPWVVNNIKGDFFWEIMAKEGYTSNIFRVPGTFPARENPGGQVQSGLGVPDMLGYVGKPFLLTNDPALTAGENEFSVGLIPLPKDFEQVTAVVPGPNNKPFFDYVVEDYVEKASDPEAARQEIRTTLLENNVAETIDINLDLKKQKTGLGITIQDQVINLEDGRWSDWVVVEFPFNSIVTLRGMVRLYLMESDPNVRLYLSPIHFHPDSHPIPFSYPEGNSAKLAEQHGLYKTMGWAVDTWTISAELGDEKHFVEDLNLTVDGYEKLLQAFLEQDHRLLVHVFEFTDRAAHVLWRLRDRGHPAYDPILSSRHEKALLEVYQRMDDLVGMTQEKMNDDDLLLVISDHGFESFRRGVNYNTWLVRNGFMTLKDDTGVMTLDDLFRHSGALFQNVDWSRTQAYALGLGNIYINLAGREPEGIVTKDEYPQVMASIQHGLEALIDPDTQEKPIHRVYPRDEIYHDYDPSITPDLRVTNTPNYRVSWQSSLGGAPPEIIEINTKPWSGDHCSVDPVYVPGIFFSSRNLDQESVHIMDIAPTLLELYGIPVPEDMDGTSFAGALK